MKRYSASRAMVEASVLLTLGLTMAASTTNGLREPKPTSDPAASEPSSRVREKTTIARDAYVGDETCRSCHKQKFDSYLLTAHHLTSRQADAESIAGKFGEDANILKTSNPGLFFRMDARGDGFFETAVWGVPPITKTRSERIDLVIGSGRKGQTYLFWKNNELYQLPISYWIDLGQWVNSPGYRDGIADFERPVISRCLECHASYAETVSGPPPNHSYKKNSLTPGISCERCHGPGRDHVALHRSAAVGSSPQAIINVSKLARDRQMDVCAQCHAGHGRQLSAAFSYVPGAVLDGYLERDHVDPGGNVEVHGNQVALLQQSRCYQASASMTCSTCHDVHAPQRDAASFSSNCLKCHKAESCGEFAKIGSQIAGNCIDCHMPVQKSAAIISESNGKQTSAWVRNHWIKVYRQPQVPQSERTDRGGRADAR